MRWSKASVSDIIATLILVINWKHRLKSWKTYSQKALQVVSIIFLRCFYWVKAITRRHKHLRRRIKIILWTRLFNLVCSWNLMDSTSSDEQFARRIFAVSYNTLCGFRLNAYLRFIKTGEKKFSGKLRSFWKRLIGRFSGVLNSKWPTSRSFGLGSF